MPKYRKTAPHPTNPRLLGRLAVDQRLRAARERNRHRRAGRGGVRGMRVLAEHVPHRGRVEQLRVLWLDEERAAAPSAERVRAGGGDALGLHQDLAGHVLHRALYPRLAPLGFQETDLEHDELVCERGGLVVDVQAGCHADLLWEVQERL